MNKNRNACLMRIRLRRLFLFFVLTQCQGLGLAQTAQTLEGNSCISCHSDIFEDMKGSIHTQQGIFCNHCHGGDPAKTTKELAKAPGTGYIGVLDKKQIVEMCGQCHADVEAMNFYGIRTDQLTRYKTSQHGKQLFKGDTRVAVCSDCHGEHDILKASDPGSSVYPTNIPKMCNRCHGNEKLMASYKLPADIFKIYQTSVHGDALLNKKDLSAANCTSCHGNHGAMPPGVRNIGTACGSCHANEKKYFLESVHAKVSQQGKFSECISCHGNHGVQQASKALYNQTCVQCHDANSAAAKKGGEILQMLSEAENKLGSVTALVKQASIEGIFVEPEMASLELIKTDVIAMAPLQHSLSLTKISELHHKVVSAVEGITKEIHKKRKALQWRKRSLLPLWGFIMVMIVVLWIKYRRLRSHGYQKTIEKNKKL